MRGHPRHAHHVYVYRVFFLSKRGADYPIPPIVPHPADELCSGFVNVCPSTPTSVRVSQAMAYSATWMGILATVYNYLSARALDKAPAAKSCDDDDDDGTTSVTVDVDPPPTSEVLVEDLGDRM